MGKKISSLASGVIRLTASRVCRNKDLLRAHARDNCIHIQCLETIEIPQFGVSHYNVRVDGEGLAKHCFHHLRG